jgi:hypothetical protein
MPILRGAQVELEKGKQEKSYAAIENKLTVDICAKTRKWISSLIPRFSLY